MIPLSTVAEVRRAFYDEYPHFHPPAGRPPRDAVVAFGQFVAELVRNGEIAPELVGRVTL